jgi:hypothetical protein
MLEDGRCDLCQSYPPCSCGQYGSDADCSDLPKYCKGCHSKQIIIDSSLKKICQLKGIVSELVKVHKNEQGSKSFNECLKIAEDLLDKI